MQTIPSLALLAFLIALTGSIGLLPALIALFLYALLPIVRNTHTGLAGVGAAMRQAALALGLSGRDTLRFIELRGRHAEVEQNPANGTALAMCRDQ